MGMAFLRGFPSRAAVECGILSFEAVFFPYMLTHEGRPVIERVRDLLPKPTEEKVAQITQRRPL